MNIGTLYEQVQQIPSIRDLSEETRRIWSVRIFDNLIDFLRMPQAFPNHEINTLVTRAWELIGWKTIPLIEDQWELPSLHFLVLGQAQKRVPFFIMPLTFLDLVRKDTPMQLGAVICMASQGQDFEWQQLDLRSRDRAAAYEAEALITMQTLHEAEGIEWKPNTYQQEILRRYPLGLNSLDVKLRLVGKGDGRPPRPQNP